MSQSKSKVVWFFIVSIGVLLLRSYPAFPEQIIIDSHNQFDFARKLMDKGEYGRAVGEFERFIYFFPDSPQIPKAQYLIGMCHLKDRRYDEAREVFFKILRSDPESSLAEKAIFLIGESYYQEGISGEAAHYFRQVAEECPHLDLKSVAFYRLGWTKMQEGRWREASKIFNKVEKESPYYDSSRELAIQSLRGEALPYKRPVFAGSLAALIPGLGHAYVARYRDATVAFLLNGIFVWAAAESFHQDHEVLGGVLTFLELGWYSGNIYSAVNVAHKYNRKAQNDFRKGLKDHFDLHLLAAKEGHVGMTLTFRF